MPSSAFRLSIRSLLLVIAFQLGFCILLLADVANTTRDTARCSPWVVISLVVLR